MSEETVVAASSAAQTDGAASSAADTTPKFTQYDGWDEDGNPVVSKKATKPEGAEAAAADKSKETTKTDDAADSAAKKGTQEKTHRKPDAEARIKELTAKLKERERELEEARKPKAPAEEKKTEKSAESSTARTEAKTGEPAPTRPKPTLGDKDAEGKTKYSSYDDYLEDLADWKVEQKMAARQREEQISQQRQSVSKQLEEARGRYADFDSVTTPLIQDLLKPEISREVFAVINDSPVLADLLYTIGGTEQSKADFLDACRTNPGKALRVALLMEQEIAKELGKGKTAAAAKKDGESGDQTSAATKPRAPKPPAEVGGRGAPGEDALISAAKTGDFRTFEAEQTRRVLASRR